MRTLRVALLAVLFALPARALDASKLPEFTGYVVDKAGVIDARTNEQLRRLASRLDHAGIAQLAVLTVPDLGDAADINELKVEVFKKWGLGHGRVGAKGGRGDGLLLVLVPGPPGHRKYGAEVGYGLEGVLPDGKVGALLREQAVPALRQDQYGEAALRFMTAAANVLSQNAGEGGELAPAPDAMRGGSGTGQASDSRGTAGLGLAVLGMGALLFSLMTSFSRQRFPGRKVALLAVAVVAGVPLLLLLLPSGLGWLVWIAGGLSSAAAWASIRSHRCPRDGGWLELRTEIVDEPTEWSPGLAVTTERCTTCTYRTRREKVLPRRERVVVVSGGGWGSGGSGFGGGGGGDSGGGFSDGFSGGGGGDSGGGGASGEV